MLYSIAVGSAREALEEAVPHSILANQYASETDPHADASAEHADERVALAARELVRAVDALPKSDRPIGWDVEAAGA